MPIEPFFVEGIFFSYIITEANEAQLTKIGRHRALKYLPQTHGGDSGFIADTDINLQKNGTFDSIIENSYWDTHLSPEHKLKRTAHFLVTKHNFLSSNSEIIVSGWIVPYSTRCGVPMEGKILRETPVYDWSDYFTHKNEYLKANNIQIDKNDVVEIGRLCRTGNCRKSSIIPILLAFKTLHKFLEELHIENYVCAAIDYLGQRYASLYECMGLRKIKQYQVETVTGLKLNKNNFLVEKKILEYCALHMNVPHVHQRIKQKEFGNKFRSNGAVLNERMLRFITPHLFGFEKKFRKMSA